MWRRLDGGRRLELHRVERGYELSLRDGDDRRVLGRAPAYEWRRAAGLLDTTGLARQRWLLTLRDPETQVLLVDDRRIELHDGERSGMPTLLSFEVR